MRINTESIIYVDLGDLTAYSASGVTVAMNDRGYVQSLFRKCEFQAFTVFLFGSKGKPLKTGHEFMIHHRGVLFMEEYGDGTRMTLRDGKSIFIDQKTREIYNTLRYANLRKL